MNINSLRGIQQDLENTLKEACHSQLIREKIIGYLKREGRGIPIHRVIRLIRFLSLIQSGQFSCQTTLEKKGAIENIFYLIQYKLEREMAQICYLFFDEQAALKKIEWFYPKTMVKSLIREARKEKDEKIEGMIWSFLFRKQVRLQNSISPPEIVFALWAEDPVFRNNMIRFMIKHFQTDSIINAVVVYMSNTGKRMPGIVFDRFMGFAKEEEKLNQKRHILAGIIRNGRLSNAEIDKIWADYLRSMNRYELIKIFSINRDILKQIEGLKKGDPQLSFGFELKKNNPNNNEKFLERVNMINSFVQ